MSLNPNLSLTRTLPNLQMSSRRGSRASHSRTPATPSAGGPQDERGQDLNQKEQEVDQQGKGSQREVTLQPAPPIEDLAQIIHNQTLILETLANALVNKRPREQTMNDKLPTFLRTKPPTFAGSSNPMDADD